MLCTLFGSPKSSPFSCPTEFFGDTTRFLRGATGGGGARAGGRGGGIDGAGPDGDVEDDVEDEEIKLVEIGGRQGAISSGGVSLARG